MKSSKKFLVYPVDSKKRILQGFCPTVVVGEFEAQKEALQMIADLFKYRVKYSAVIVEEA